MNIFLLGYLVLFLSITLGLRSYLAWRATGINPYVFGRSDSAYDYVTSLFKGVIAALVISVVLNALGGQAAAVLMPIALPKSEGFAALGVLLLVLAFVCVVIAQMHMGHSWRIGIPVGQVAPELVTSGIFSRSRNPIFLGMSLALIGVFLLMPGAASLHGRRDDRGRRQVQARLEESFLLAAHGMAYQTYRAATPRWL